MWCMQEYSDHHEKILAKFVSIIGELIANSAASSLQVGANACPVGPNRPPGVGLTGSCLPAC